MILALLFTTIVFAARIRGADSDDDNDSNSDGHNCGQNEEWTPCGDRCEGKCSQTSYSICPITCESYGCACQYGYYRNQHGFCVPKCSCFLSTQENYPCNLRCDSEHICEVLKIFCPYDSNCHPVPYCVWRDTDKNPGLLGSIDPATMGAE